jgi:hypothetical protein
MTDDISREDLRRALQQVELQAAEHGAEYAAGMRHGRLIIEDELLTDP